jgi:SEC-C motif-containing protein
MNKQKLCPCNPQLLYENCCKPYHLGRSAETALILMRSRYSAYAFNLPGYIIRTTHPQNPHYFPDKKEWQRSISSFSKNCHFNRLEILEVTETTVTFTAHLTTKKGGEATFTEKSTFAKINDQWLYLSGIVV